LIGFIFTENLARNCDIVKAINNLDLQILSAEIWFLGEVMARASPVMTTLTNITCM